MNTCKLEDLWCNLKLSSQRWQEPVAIYGCVEMVHLDILTCRWLDALLYSSTWLMAKTSQCMVAKRTISAVMFMAGPSSSHWVKIYSAVGTCFSIICVDVSFKCPHMFCPISDGTSENRDTVKQLSNADFFCLCHCIYHSCM